MAATQVEGETLLEEDFTEDLGWRTVSSRKSRATTKPGLGDGGARSEMPERRGAGEWRKGLVIKNRIVKASRMPPMPEEHIKIVIRPRGGLNLEKVSPPTLVEVAAQPEARPPGLTRLRAASAPAERVSSLRSMCVVIGIRIRIAQLERENRSLKAAVDGLVKEIAELRRGLPSGNSGSIGQASKHDDRVEVPTSVEAAEGNMDDEETPAPKKRALSSMVQPQGKVRSELKEMMVTLQESVNQVISRLERIEERENITDQRLCKIEVYLNETVVPVMERECSRTLAQQGTVYKNPILVRCTLGLRHQHRRLLLTLDESGLVMHALGGRPLPNSKRGLVAFDVPFSDYAAVYAVGNSLALWVLAAEAIGHRCCKGRQRRRGRHQPCIGR
ncbi:hypothetical protein HPB49_026288 [Dermacentor silvarum]|nr:hypothetical protein HPB49_026288 [Dermacentor silvarum]